MSLRVKYLDVPEGAQEAACVEAQGQPFSEPMSVATGAPDVAYATLEPEGWPLDGTRKVVLKQPQYMGWWSTERSGENGVFVKAPSLSISFPAVYTATGLSFVFWPSSNEWCSEILVTWYNGGEILRQVKAAPSGPIWTLQETVEGFDQIQINLLATNIPGHFAKIQKIEIGQTYWFDQEEITAVHIVNEIDPSLSTLTVDTMQIDIRDRRGLDLIPQKNQQMELYQNGTLYAAHYITTGSRQAKQYYTFSCQSAIGLLEDDYLGGMFDAVPVATVLEDILDGFPFALHSSFAKTAVTGYLPICTRREALQQLAFALGAVVSTQGSRTIQIIPLSAAVTSTIINSNIFRGGKVEMDPRIAKVEVVAHKYSKAIEVETLLDAENINGNDVLVTFAEPHHSYSITGGTLTGSGANWVTITAAGDVTLIGKKYLHSTVRHIQRNTEATASERNNVFSVEEATLVHSGNVVDVLRRLYSISQFRQTLSQEIVVTTQRAGQKVTSENPWGDLLQGYIAAMESDFTSTGHTAAITVLGVKLNGDHYHYSGQLQAGDSEAIYGVGY